MGGKRFGWHYGVNHVVVVPVAVFDPTVAFRLTVDFCAGKRRQDTEHYEVGVQVVGELSKLEDGLVGFFAVADDDHGVGEDAVVMQ